MKTETDYERLPETVESLPVGIPEMSAKLVIRTDKKALYYRWDNVYEVFKIKIAEPTEIYGRVYPRREVYPGNEDFGAIAWCYHDKQLAMDMYNRI